MAEYWIYQDESGEPGKDDYFIVGILCMTSGQKNKAIKLIQDLRNEENYFNEFHFNKFSEKRKRVYSMAIDLLFNCCYVTFRSIVVNRSLVNLRAFGYKRHFVYNKFTHLLIEHTIKFKQDAEIHIRPDYKNRLKHDNFYSYLVNTLNYNAWLYGYTYYVKSCESSDSKMCDMNQMCDLLTGIVKNRYIPAGERKNQFASEILDKYKEKIKIWEWRPNKVITS